MERGFQGRSGSQGESREGRKVRLSEMGRLVGDEERRREDRRRRKGRMDLLRVVRDSRVDEEVAGSERCSSSGELVVEEGTAAGTGREHLREEVEQGSDGTSSRG